MPVLRSEGIDSSNDSLATRLVTAMLFEVSRTDLQVFAVVTLVSLYPVFAGHMPGPIAGLPRDLASTASFHFASSPPRSTRYRPARLTCSTRTSSTSI